VLRRAVALGLIALFFADLASASFRIMNVIAVPMENGEEGTVELRYVTVSMDYTFKWPGIEVQYTCSIAPVQHFRQVFDQADQKGLEVDDANIAHVSGLAIQTENRSDETTWNSPESMPPGSRWGRREGWPKDPYVDTLLVQLNTERAYRFLTTNLRPDSLQLHLLDAVVATTIDCIQDNASRSIIPIRHVKLVVTGPARYRKLSGLIAITSRPNRGPRHSYGPSMPAPSQTPSELHR
jgi:hypothetical protein